MAKPARHDITDPAQLDALASSVRQEILDTVIALRACSIREIAGALGRSADGLYYHVRALVQAGLLSEDAGRSASGRPETVYRTRSRGIQQLRYRPEDADHANAVRRIARAMLRSAERDFSAGLASGRARPGGADRNILASRQRARLTRAQRREINALLARLQEIFHDSATGDDAGAELMSVTVVLAPIEPAPLRRES
jgi:DNA-binding IclR family transcriptional regulator